MKIEHQTQEKEESEEEVNDTKKIGRTTIGARKSETPFAKTHANTYSRKWKRGNPITACLIAAAIAAEARQRIVQVEKLPICYRCSRVSAATVAIGSLSVGGRPNLG